MDLVYYDFIQYLNIFIIFLSSKIQKTSVIWPNCFGRASTYECMTTNLA